MPEGRQYNIPSQIRNSDVIQGFIGSERRHRRGLSDALFRRSAPVFARCRCALARPLPRTQNQSRCQLDKILAAAAALSLRSAPFIVVCSHARVPMWSLVPFRALIISHCKDLHFPRTANRGHHGQARARPKQASTRTNVELRTFFFEHP